MNAWSNGDSSLAQIAAIEGLDLRFVIGIRSGFGGLKNYLKSS